MNVVNTYVPNLPSQEKCVSFLAVLTKDLAGKYACYTGLVKLPVVPGDYSETEPVGKALWDAYKAARGRAAEWVAACGAKQNYRATQAYFTGIAESEYRA